MKLAVVGCSHHSASLEVRERLAFSADEARRALALVRDEFAGVEAVLLSTCNRVELYTAAENGDVPPCDAVAGFLASFHRLDPAAIRRYLYDHQDRQAVRHLFRVACSLDSMVVGEPQILNQVKAAYQLATEVGTAGPLVHAAFQAALKTARRVAGETALHQHRVSIPSVAVVDLGRQIFERFDDKRILIIGAGEMAEETLCYLKDQGGRDVTVINRSPDRADDLARRFQGRTVPWDRLREALAGADVVVSVTGAGRPVVTLDDFRAIETQRYERPLFILDLAVPRDFDPAIGQRPGVYLYCLDDLREVCQQNQRQRDAELPAALRIIEHETARLWADLQHRAASPVIRRLREDWQKPKEEELKRLLNKLPELDARAQAEIREAFDRLINKLLHPPMESLRDESRHGFPDTLAQALAKLFRLKD